MTDSSLTVDILDQLRNLGPDDQQRVLDFARALASKVATGVPGRDLLQFVGTIDPEDLRAMAQAIEEGCERAAPHADSGSMQRMRTQATPPLSRGMREL